VLIFILRILNFYKEIEKLTLEEIYQKLDYESKDFEGTQNFQEGGNCRT